LGREHALLFASEGAAVVVNDLGGDERGGGADRTPAEQTVADIEIAGGQAVVNGDDVADWAGAKRLVDLAIERFGDLHILVNNAGIVRDRVIVNMSEDEWDSVVNVHLKGHVAPTHHAAAYWRERAKAGQHVNAAIVHTTSTSGLFSNPGQANYGAAKAGIAALSQICAKELERYGVRSNAIAPAARTRMTLGTPGVDELVKAPDGDAFDEYHPANVSPFVAYLATADCPFNGETFFVGGGTIRRLQSWRYAEKTQRDRRWTISEIAGAMTEFQSAADSRSVPGQ
jgi:NAD(P)-dependent dehydrogenase (short-subunit alcohol dehydrogenase family)